ncbi:hypothetical protein VPH35_050570 [Triticum aestivum]
MPVAGGGGAKAGRSAERSSNEQIMVSRGGGGARRRCFHLSPCRHSPSRDSSELAIVSPKVRCVLSFSPFISMHRGIVPIESMACHCDRSFKSSAGHYSCEILRPIVSPQFVV